MFENQIQKNKSLENSIVEVLVENFTEDKTKTFGRSKHMTSVIFDGKKSDIGKIVQVKISKSNGKIREGLSADMLVPLREVIAHLIPSYLISLNDEGDLGIKILSDNRVQFTEIQIVEDTIDGLWVTGLPKDVTIITVGQEYVINGQEVKVQMLN